MKNANLYALLLQAIKYRMPDKNYYEILGVARNSTAKEIKNAFHRLAREKHPDRNLEDPAANSSFQELEKAYDTLKNPNTRKTYDAMLQEDNPEQHEANNYHYDWFAALAIAIANNDIAELQLLLAYTDQMRVTYGGLVDRNFGNWLSYCAREKQNAAALLLVANGAEVNFITKVFKPKDFEYNLDCAFIALLAYHDNFQLAIDIGLQKFDLAKTNLSENEVYKLENLFWLNLICFAAIKHGAKDWLQSLVAGLESKDQKLIVNNFLQYSSGLHVARRNQLIHKLRRQDVVDYYLCSHIMKLLMKGNLRLEHIQTILSNDKITFKNMLHDIERYSKYKDLYICRNIFLMLLGPGLLFSYAFILLLGFASTSYDANHNSKNSTSTNDTYHRSDGREMFDPLFYFGATFSSYFAALVLAVFMVKAIYRNDIQIKSNPEQFLLRRYNSHLLHMTIGSSSESGNNLAKTLCPCFNGLKSLKIKDEAVNVAESTNSIEYRLNLL